MASSTLLKEYKTKEVSGTTNDAGHIDTGLTTNNIVIGIKDSNGKKIIPFTSGLHVFLGIYDSTLQPFIGDVSITVVYI